VKSVLLLGGAGFVGFNVARHLASRGDCRITIADSFFRAGGKVDDALAALASAHRIGLVRGDFTDPAAFRLLGERYDEVYMLASMVGVDYVNTIPHEIVRVNASLILNTLEWLRAGRCARVLFTSTSECYAGAVEASGHPVPTAEDVPLTIQDIAHPRFTYAVTKMLGESGFLNYARVLGFECVVIRYHNVYGPRMGFKHVIPHLAQRFGNGERPFRIFGHDQTRSFNHVDDAVRGTVLAMEKGRSGQIYHIGDMDEITIEALVRYVGSLAGYDGEYENAPTYPGSVSRRCPDIAKARRELGYEPEVAWRDGVRDTVRWYWDYLRTHERLHESFYDLRG
jgi:nucleoside-diphosphate-sugar epimerase